MQEFFTVARHSFSITIRQPLRAWASIKHRFAPFASAPTEMPVLAIDVKCGLPAQYDGECIYEPVHGGIGYIAARTTRLSDESLVIEFLHTQEQQPRLWLKMSASLHEAEISILSGDDRDDPYFLAHALMIAFMLATTRSGTLLIHASSVIYEGQTYLFQGKSGTGKSTHASLWTNNIPGAELLNDDNPFIRFSEDGEAMAYGSPWSGKTPCYRNIEAPLGAIVRIVRAPKNELHRLSPLKAYASLTSSVFYMPFLSERLREIRHKTIEHLATQVPCYEMHCLPDADAALTCMRGVSAKG